MGNVEVKTEMYKTYKASAGDVGFTLAGEAVMNIESATFTRGPATGGFSLRTILQIVCLQIDSHTGVMTTNHYCDKASMCEMFSMGPSDGSRGIHNMKGIGLRLLQASLGGMEHDAAELLAISVDGRTGRGAIARTGPMVDAMYEEGLNLARVALDFVVVRDAATGQESAQLCINSGHNDIIAEKLLCQSGHPFQVGENNGETKRRLMDLAMECYRAAAADDNREKQFTRFLYFNLGTTGAGAPLLEVMLDEDGNETDIKLNPQDEAHNPQLLSQIILESYVPPSTGLYPLAGTTDDDDVTDGAKNITVQGVPVFRTPSFLGGTWTDVGPIRSNVITIPCGGGRSMYMVACWVTPEGADGAAVKAPGIRLKLHKGEEFHTGTYFAYRDKIINAYDPKSINTSYEGSHHYTNALNALTSQTASGREVAHKSLFNAENGPVKKWLGFDTWDDWAAAGFPPRESIKTANGFDKERLYEMLTCGAIFIVRIDEVVGLDTRKDKMVQLQGTDTKNVSEIIYEIRREQVKWCLQNKTQERIAKEQEQQRRNDAWTAHAASIAPPIAPGALVVNGHAQPHVEAPGGRSARKRAATAPYQGGDASSRGGGGGGGKKKAKAKKAKAPPPEQIVTEAVRPVDAFIKTAALSTASIDELRNLNIQMIQTLEQAGLYTRESGAGSSSSSAGPSAAAAMEVVNADDDDDEQDATPVQGNDGSVVLDADEVLDDDSDDLD